MIVIVIVRDIGCGNDPFITYYAVPMTMIIFEALALDKCSFIFMRVLLYLKYLTTVIFCFDRREEWISRRRACFPFITYRTEYGIILYLYYSYG